MVRLSSEEAFVGVSHCFWVDFWVGYEELRGDGVYRKAG